MTKEEFEIIQRMDSVNREVGRIIEKFILAHKDDYKFNLSPLGRSDFTESDVRLENFYAGML